MWILVKLSIAIGAFVYRFFIQYYAGRDGERIETESGECHIVVTSNKRRVVWTTFRIPLDTKAIFKITRESKWDRFFKYIGLSAEVETTDLDFNQRFYIASDSPVFCEEIQTNGIAREFIKSIFASNCRNLWADGNNLWVQFPGKLTSPQVLAQECVDFANEIRPMGQNNPWIWHDPFAWKALVIESLVWFLGGYAFAGYMEWQFFNEDLHLFPNAVFWRGLIFGGLGAFVFLCSVVALMRGSSRGHRIILETLIIAVLSFPMGGIHLVSDLNTQFDKSEPKLIVAKITGLTQKEHRGRRSRRYYTYHMSLDPSVQVKYPGLPTTIQIYPELFRQLRQDGLVKLQIGKGWLGHPWYRSIAPTIDANENF